MNGTTLRVSDFKPQAFTILGLAVPDIRKAVSLLRDKGVKFEIYGLPGQDPDGLSLTQMP